MVAMKCLASARATFALWLLAATALLGGCGPGVGGTGTGDAADALGAFGATAASVCAGELATVLACAATTGGGGGGGGTAAAPAPGTAPVYLADTIDGRRVAVSVQGNLIDVNAPCARVRFRGQWGTIAGQAARFYGSTEQDGSSTPATLQAVVRGSGLELTLVDTQGRVLLGPVLVTARPAPVAAGDCG